MNTLTFSASMSSSWVKYNNSAIIMNTRPLTLHSLTSLGFLAFSLLVSSFGRFGAKGIDRVLISGCVWWVWLVHTWCWHSHLQMHTFVNTWRCVYWASTMPHVRAHLYKTSPPYQLPHSGMPTDPAACTTFYFSAWKSYLTYPPVRQCDNRNILSLW